MQLQGQKAGVASTPLDKEGQVFSEEFTPIYTLLSVNETFFMVTLFSHFNRHIKIFLSGFSLHFLQ